MPAPTLRPAADTLDDRDRATSDAGATGDKYIDATRAVSQGERDADEAVLEDHEGSRVILDEDADLGMARDSMKPADPPRGADDDDPIDEVERAGDDAIR